MNARAETTAVPETAVEARERISEAEAEDHVRLLAMVSTCLAEIGIKAALTTFHNLVLYAEEYLSRLPL